MSDTTKMKWLSKRQRELLATLYDNPKEIGIVRELIEVNAAMRLLDSNNDPLYVAENYRREDWIAETN
jgi:hypothetical protein